MFGIFKRKKRSTSPIYPAWQKAGDAIEKKQKQWAEYLGQGSRAWPRIYIKMVLVVFCLLYGGISIYLMLDVFREPSAKIGIDKISVPAHVIHPDTILLNQQLPLIAENEYQHIKAFRLYMDSLKHSSIGKLIYDSILHTRPGLLDSISLAESLYQQQTKK